jgi:hypothetical protein
VRAGQNEATKASSQEQAAKTNLAKFALIAALNCDVEPGKLAVLQRNFLHASTLMFGGWIRMSTLEEKVNE